MPNLTCLIFLIYLNRSNPKYEETNLRIYIICKYEKESSST